MCETHCVSQCFFSVFVFYLVDKSYTWTDFRLLWQNHNSFFILVIFFILYIICYSLGYKLILRSVSGTETREVTEPEEKEPEETEPEERGEGRGANEGPFQQGQKRDGGRGTRSRGTTEGQPQE